MNATVKKNPLNNMNNNTLIEIIGKTIQSNTVSKAGIDNMIKELTNLQLVNKNFRNNGEVLKNKIDEMIDLYDLIQYIYKVCEYLRSKSNTSKCLIYCETPNSISKYNIITVESCKKGTDDTVSIKIPESEKIIIEFESLGYWKYDIKPKDVIESSLMKLGPKLKYITRQVYEYVNDKACNSTVNPNEKLLEETHYPIFELSIRYIDNVNKYMNDAVKTNFCKDFVKRLYTYSINQNNRIYYNEGKTYVIYKKNNKSYIKKLSKTTSKFTYRVIFPDR